MATLNVALLQLRSPGADPERALAEGDRACRRAATFGADIALFPELWQIGYQWWDDPAEARESYSLLATDSDGDFVGHFRDLARELEMAIVITYLQRTEGLPLNSATLLDRSGRPVLSYSKVHTCDFSIEAGLEPGSEFPAADLETAAGPVRIGIMICYDREFPESARLLMLAGAEIILAPNACPIDVNRLEQLRTRAFENMVGVAMANYAAPDPRRPASIVEPDGHSLAFSGIAYGEDHQARDHKLVEAGEDEGVFLARFDLEALREYRRKGVWGDTYRKPSAYGALLENEPPPEFRRGDSRR
jgi:predicted amidohydrolase